MKTPFRILLLPALVLLWSPGVVPSARALDFTLHHMAGASGTFKLTKTYFLDGDSKIFMEIPLDWKVTDTAVSLDCTPPRANSRVYIEQAGSQPWAFDEPSKIALRKKALEAVPEGAKGVTALPEQTDLVPLAGWSCLELSQEYEFFGQKMHRSQLFMNLPEKRVWKITITAPEADFGAIHEQTRQMLYTMFEPTKMLSPVALKRYNEGITD